MTTTATRVEDIDRIERGEEAWRLARAAYGQLIALLEDLEPEEWRAETVCAPWTVADMVGHVIGSAKGQASLLEMARTQMWAWRHKGEFGDQPLDAWTGLHVREHADLTPEERIEALRDVAPRAVRGRARVPGFLGPIPMPVEDGGSMPDGAPDRLTTGHLYTVVLTRDTWLHRIDIVRAVDREPGLDRDVDGRIVEDVVAEWGARHGRPFHLTLTGPAGGVYQQGEGGPRIELDAVDLAWILSGRSEPGPDIPGADLLRVRVLF